MYELAWRNRRESGGWLGTFRLPPSGTVRIGRDKASDVQLKDPSVSRAHAIVICDGDCIEIADQGSANGTRLGRGRLSHSSWPVDQSVLIGPFELQLVKLQSAPADEASVLAMPEVSTARSESQTYRHSHILRSAAAPPGMLDARPRFVSGANSLWDAAAHRRGAFANQVREILVEQRIQAELDVSQPSVYPPNLTLRCWLPTSRTIADPLDMRMRSSLSLAVDVKPFHTHRFAHTVELEKAGRKFGLWLQPDKVALFNENDLRAWVLFALGRGSKPYSRVGTLLKLLKRLVPLLGFRNEVTASYRNSWIEPRRLIPVGFVVAYGLISNPQPISQLVGMAVGLASGIGYYLNRSKELLVCTPPTPTSTPRALRSWGGWDMVLPMLGEDFNHVNSRILRAVADNRPEHVEVLEEVWSQWTADGLEQRHRTVYKHRQCELHLHVYQLGPDLFLGWNAFINSSQWGESKTATSRKRVRDKTIEFREVRPAVYAPTDFDWIDLRGLAEFVQRRLEQIIRILVKEKNIDIELDFKIEKSGIEASAAGKPDAAGKRDGAGLFRIMRSSDSRHA